MDYEMGFDQSVGFRKSPIEGGDYGMKEIEPYMESIIDAGIPKGVLKTIEEIKKLNSKYNQLEKEFEKISNEILKITNDNYKYYMDVNFPERKKKAIIKTKKEVTSQIKRMEEIIREVKGNIANKKLERMESILRGTIES
jgi:chromosome segregation ATPase